MTGRALTGVLLAVLASGLVGCSDQTAGDPHAQGDPSEQTSSTSEPDPTTATRTSSGTGTELAGLQPCDLVSDSDKDRLGFRREEPAESTGERGCNWIFGSGTQTTAIGVILVEDRGLGELVGKDGDPKPITIGERAAREARNTGGGACIVAIGITDKSRVDFQAIGAGSDLEPTCRAARDLAELVEPELPQGE